MNDENDSKQEPGDDELQAWLRQDADNKAPPFDPDQSLRKVLSHAKQQTVTRDVMSFFMSWFWMLFAGFGASLYGASQRRHPPRKRPPRKTRPAPTLDQ